MNSPQFLDAQAKLEKLHKNKGVWARLSVERRIDFLRRSLRGLDSIAQEWVRQGQKLKHLSNGGEDWLAGPFPTARLLRLLIRSLKRNASPTVPLSRLYNGQQAAQVFPADLSDRIFYRGMRAELRIQSDRPPTQGRTYRRDNPDKGRVSLVLGAGNITSIAPTDAFHKLYVENEVVLLKSHRLLNDLVPLYERAFKALIDDGFLEIIADEPDLAPMLCRHSLVDSIHVTGAVSTHDAIVWGTSKDEQEQNRKAGTPINHKTITSELGCVTPVFVVPGEWSDSDLRFQAEHVASMVTHNASFNCNAAKVLVTARNWKQRSKFLEYVAATLASIPARYPYYPGATERYRRFMSAYPSAEKLSSHEVPWTLIRDVPVRANELALSEEAFCGVLAEAALESENALSFLADIIEFAHHNLFGTLSCAILIHPRTRKACSHEFDVALTKLRYGAIGVNVWPGVIFALGSTGWGAYPGNTLENIGSGIGQVHNAFLFDHPEKSVLYAPFRVFPKPPWFTTHRNLESLGRKLTKFEIKPSVWKIPGIIAAALRG